MLHILIDTAANQVWPKALNEMWQLPGEKKTHAEKASRDSEGAELLIKRKQSDNAAFLPQSLGP